jgi:hypothetical protein
MNEIEPKTKEEMDGKPGRSVRIKVILEYRFPPDASLVDMGEMVENIELPKNYREDSFTITSFHQKDQNGNVTKI